MLLFYKHVLIVLYICMCIACIVGNIVWATLLFDSSSKNNTPSLSNTSSPSSSPSNTSSPSSVNLLVNKNDSSETIITIKSDVSLNILKGVCIISNTIVIPILVYFFYLYKNVWW